MRPSLEIHYLLSRVHEGGHILVTHPRLVCGWATSFPETVAPVLGAPAPHLQRTGLVYMSASEMWDPDRCGPQGALHGPRMGPGGKGHSFSPMFLSSLVQLGTCVSLRPSPTACCPPLWSEREQASGSELWAVTVSYSNMTCHCVHFHSDLVSGE